MLGTKHISMMLSYMLDSNGYDSKTIQERIWMNDHTSLAMSQAMKEILNDPAVDRFLVGSIREGISMLTESDQDWMQVNTSVMCTDHTTEITDKMILFTLDRKIAPPGYTFLRYDSQGINARPYFDKLRHALQETEKGTFLLSSSRYMEYVYDDKPGTAGTKTTNTKGPSIPGNFFKHWKMTNALFERIDICTDIDFVRGFICNCPSLLNSWLDRKRPFHWPDKATKTRIATMPYHVVPTGLSGTDNERFQWRICFTMAEICLVQSLNDTQRKLLILLRLMARHLLKPVAPDITSYIMKNVVFWMVEDTPAESFTTDQLFDRILDAVDFLIKRVKKGNMCNYMIPGRNLLHGKFQGEQRNCLLAKLKVIKVIGQSKLSIMIQNLDNIEQNYPEIYSMLVKADIRNHGNKFANIICFSVPRDKLAHAFVRSYLCRYGIVKKTFLLMSLFCRHGLPVFGMRWLSDPFSIDLEEIRTKSETYSYRSICYKTLPFLFLIFTYSYLYT